MDLQRKNVEKMHENHMNEIRNISRDEVSKRKQKINRKILIIMLEIKRAQYTRASWH